MTGFEDVEPKFVLASLEVADVAVTALVAKSEPEQDEPWVEGAVVAA